MTIRKKTLLIIGLPFICLVAVQAVLSYQVVIRRFARLEAKETQTQMLRVRSEISDRIAHIEATGADWAPWDDTYAFIHDVGQAYVDNNLVPSTFMNLRLNFMLFFDAHGGLVYDRFFDLAQNRVVDRDPAVIKAVATASRPSLLYHPDVRHRTSGILMIGPSAYMVTSQPIATSEFKGPARGTLVLGRALDIHEVKRISEVTKTPLVLHTLAGAKAALPAATVSAVVEQSSGVVTRPVSADTIAGYTRFDDVSGKPALILEMARNRDIYQYGLSTWRQDTAATSFFGLLFIGLLMIVLDRTILNRLAGLAKDVNAIAGTGTLTQRLNITATDEIGQLEGSINTMLDALQQSHGDQAAAQSELEESKYYLRELLDSVDCGIMVVDVETRRVVDVNTAAAALFNRARNEVLGQVCHRFVCHNEQCNCPVLDQDQTLDLSQRKLLRADGSTLPVLKTVARTEHRGRAYLIESFTDISNLEKAEADLKQSEERYRRFFEEDITGDALSSVDGTLIDCNAAFACIFGYDSIDETKTVNVNDHYLDQADRRVLMEKLKKEKKLERIPLSMVHRDGHPLHCIANIVGHFDEDGNLTEISSYLLDDTKRVNLEADLRQAQKIEAIGTLAGGIAHDFNNILSGIMGYTEIALDKLPAASEPAGTLRKVLAATQRAKELVQQILTFSRQGESDPRPLKLAPVVKEVLKLIRATLPTTIDIRRQIDAHPIVVADPVQIHQVIMNLCTNAGHAMKGGGTLTVTVSCKTLDEAFTGRYPEMVPGAFAHICVEDTGDGIPDAILGRVFDPFFTTKDKTGGTGLGLSVVHGIVTNLGGAVTIASGPGGSRFDVYLPLTEEKAERKDKRQAAIPRGSESIVYIDDETFLVEIAAQMLESLGYRVTGFSDSSQALAYITENPDKVDLVVTDMTMPRLTGMTLARKLLETRPGLPIIIGTGFSETLSEEKALEMGIRGYLMKPILLSNLARMIRDILDNPMTESR